jgi:hypothetical protein
MADSSLYDMGAIPKMAELFTGCNENVRTHEEFYLLGYNGV